MIRRFLALFRRRGSPDLIHSRAVRVCNRKPENIAKYRRVHEILRRGPNA
jgi:hypothetical protein